MSGYIEAGYAIVLGSLALYGATLLMRERSVRRRSGVASELAPRPGCLPAAEPPAGAERARGAASPIEPPAGAERARGAASSVEPPAAAEPAGTGQLGAPPVTAPPPARRDATIQQGTRGVSAPPALGDGVGAGDLAVSAPPADGVGVGPATRTRAADRRHAGSQPRSLKARRTRRNLSVCAVVLLAAVGFLVYKGLTSAFVYFKTASQAVAERAALGNASFQIEGTVVPCTIRKVGATAYDFTISSGTTRVPVDETTIPPSLFQADVAVVLGGHFVGSSDVFSSNQIFIKHSNSYVAAHPGRLARQDLVSSCSAGSS